jgi:hypothetical protein
MRASVDVGMIEPVAADAASGYFGFRDGALGQTTARDVELDDVGHLIDIVTPTNVKELEGFLEKAFLEPVSNGKC